MDDQVIGVALVDLVNPLNFHRAALGRGVDQDPVDPRTFLRELQFLAAIGLHLRPAMARACSRTKSLFISISDCVAEVLGIRRSQLTAITGASMTFMVRSGSFQVTSAMPSPSVSTVKFTKLIVGTHA